MTRTDLARADEIGSGLPSGAAFPGSPSSGDLFFNTTHNMLFRYDGTRWLSESLGFQVVPSLDNTYSANATVGRVPMPFAGTFGIYIERFYVSLFVVTTNTGAAFWTATLKTWDGATGPTSRGSGLNTSAHAANLYVAQSEAIGVALTGHETAQVDIAKTGAPGDLIYNAGFSYRIIGT